MGVRERQRAVQLYRGQVPSPGRPTVAWREDRVRFWAAIARGIKTEDACLEARVSGPVGFRWFRHAGGVNPRLPSAVSGRYLSFAEREVFAIWHAQKLSAREIARRLGRDPSTISRELRRNASTRTYRLDYKASIAQWHYPVHLHAREREPGDRGSRAAEPGSHIRPHAGVASCGNLSGHPEAEDVCCVYCV
jgi:DNA-binding CsgD family transcriptional regulator